MEIKKQSNNQKAKILSVADLPVVSLTDKELSVVRGGLIIDNGDNGVITSGTIGVTAIAIGIRPVGGKPAVGPPVVPSPQVLLSE